MEPGGRLEIRAADYTFFTPVNQDEQPEEHSSEMGEMRHRVGLAVVDAQQQFHPGIYQHKYPGLDGYGWEYEVKPHVGEHVAECQQYSENRA